MGVDIIRLAPHRFFETGNAFIEFALVLEHQAQIIARFEIIRIDRQRLTVARLGGVMSSERAQRVAEVGMAAGIVRIERDGAAVACHRGVKSTLGAQRHAHVVQRLRMVAIDIEGSDITGDHFVELACPMGADRLVENPLRALGAFFGAFAHAGQVNRPLEHDSN